MTPVLDKPNSPDSEAYRSLRGKLDLMTKGKVKPVIAVSSTAPGEGKTYTSINIASSFALTRKNRAGGLRPPQFAHQPGF